MPIDAAIDAMPDAGDELDLACLGQPATATAPDPLAVDGTVFAIDHYHVAPLAGATVTLHRRADDGVIASLVTGADGTYALSIATGGAAVDAYYTVDAAGELPARIDPGDPLTTGFFALAVVASEAEVARWYGDAGATYTTGASTLISIAVDCSHTAVPAATTTIAPTGQLTYYDAAAMRWDPQLAASTNGFTLVTNAAANETVTAAWHGQAFPAHPAVAPAGTLSVAVATPHN
ncbi:MAG TPA: hypothetical protein VGO00_12805 [Kofleriaceae bacterium]|nr:hypothetical protein [Kofleriaceae bacterium]